MVNHLSYSQISALLRCGRAYEFRYLRKMPVPLPIRLLAGRVYHHCISVAASRKQLFGELISDEDIADTFCAQWDREVAGKLVYDEMGEEKVEATIIDMGDEDPEVLKDSGLKLAQMYVNKVLPTLNIVGIEKRLTTDIDGVPFIGFVDLLLAGDVVVDHKLSRRKNSQDEADKDLQISAYATLLGKPVTGQFHFALDTKEKRIEVVETKRDTNDIEWFRELVKLSSKQIDTGLFLPNPLSWTCSPDGCGYWLDCKKGWF